MSLTKGFLRFSHPVLKRQWVITGILLGIGLSLPIYAFCIKLQEALRIMTLISVDDLLTLSPAETLFYHSFYAVISSVIGCSFALKFILENSRYQPRSKLRLKMAWAIHDQSYFTWHTINWMGKTFMITGIWFITVPLHFDISFFDEFWYFFLCLPVVWFLSLWLTIRRMFIKQSIRWMGLAVLLISIDSFLLTRLDLGKPDNIDQLLQNNTIQHNYRINPPSTLTFSSFNRMGIELYVGYNRNDKSGVVKLIKDNRTEIDLREVHLYLLEEMDRYADYERSRPTVTLLVDSTVKMHTVHLLLQAMERTDIEHVRYQTNPVYGKYPADYPLYKYLGIQRTVPRSCDCEIDMIDSIRSKDITASQLSFPDTYCYRMANLTKFNRVRITIDDRDSVFLNHSSITDKKLRHTLMHFIDIHAMQYVILLDVAENSSYGRYIKIIDLIRSIVFQKRQMISMNQFHTPYHIADPLIRDTVREEVERMVPLYIVEMTYADRYLDNYIHEVP